MSAQAGVWNFDQASASRESLARISETIAQYGPDGESAYFNGSIGILYRPFHTTKESRQERQPFVSQRGCVFTWDGRLDNRDKLIPQLQCDLNSEQTDLGIVVAAFERWGMECFRKLVGDWAIAVWNPSQKVLVLARDYIGVRQLYYHATSKRVIWCTNLASLALSGDSFSLDEEYVAGYLALYPEAHLTPYREIRAVPPGSFVSIRASGSTVRPYWTFNPRLKIRYKTDPEYEEHFRGVFRQAVRRRLRSDSPILADLSGGLDSSSVVCMADDILAQEGAEPPRLDTLSFYDAREPDGDERPYFTKIEEKRGRKGHHCDAGTEALSISSRLPYFVSRPGDLGHTRRVTEDFRRGLIKQQGYRVALSGIGGDEFLGGVPDPTFQLADLIQQCRLIELAKQLKAWCLVKRRPLIQLLGQTSVLLLPRRIRALLAPVEPWIEPTFAKRQHIAARTLGPAAAFGFRLQSRRAFAQTVVLISCQQSCATDWSGQGAEWRFPYLDQDLIEFLLAVPATQLLRPGERRSLMRRALSQLVPKEVLERKSKAVTVRKALVAVQANWQTLEELLSSAASASLGFVNRTVFMRKLVQAKGGEAPQLVRLLRGIALELWLRDVIQRGVVKIPSGSPEMAMCSDISTFGSHKSEMAS